MPNVDAHFDVATFALQFIALRDIKAGEQLLYSYCAVTQSAKARQANLMTCYGFVCNCKACANATPASDRLREEFYDRIHRLFDERGAMYSDPQFNIRSLDPLLQLEKDIVEEELDIKTSRFVQLLYVIAEGYRRLGHPAKSQEYLTRAFKYHGNTKLS
jgi:hypothetical protein